MSWRSFTWSLRTRSRPDMRDFAPNRDIENRMRVLIGSWGCDVLTGGRGTTRSAARTGTTGAPARSSSRGCCAAVPQRRRPPGQGPRGIWRCTATRCRAAGRFGTGPGTSRAPVVSLVSQLPRRVRRCRPASAGQSRCRVAQLSGTTAFADKIAPVRFAWVRSSACIDAVSVPRPICWLRPGHGLAAEARTYGCHWPPGRLRPPRGSLRGPRCRSGV
jgi:hypothetical protein